MCCALLTGSVAVFGVDGQQRMEWKALHSAFVYDVDWAHADRCASASNDSTCKVWHPQTGEPARVTPLRR
jgi:WD40 repeat protein